MIKSPRHKDTHGSSAFPRQDSAASSISSSSLRGQQFQEEASVSNLRKLYSSLLEELAPLHHELGTNNNATSYNDNQSNNKSSNNQRSSNSNNNANYRWKNNGTITVEGADDTGYDYSYTPDNAVHSWRLGNLRSAQSAANPRGVNNKKGRKGKEGIMGGDWSKDGVRRYYTGGVTAVGVGRSGAVMKESLNEKKNEKSIDDNVVVDEKVGNEEVPSADFDTASVNGIQLDERFSIQDDEDDDDHFDMFDVNILSPVPSVDVEGGDTTEKSEDDKHQLDNHALQMPTLEPPSSSATLDKTPTKHPSQKKKQRHTAASIMRSSSSRSNDSNSPHSSPPKSPPLSSFESLYNITNNNAMTTWYVRSAYVPTTPYEKQLLRTSSTTTTNNNNSTSKSKAKSIMSGNNQAQNSQVRICHTLKRIAEILCISERRKGRKFIGKNSHYLDQSQRQNSVTMVESSSEDEEELEVSEAVFAYFCEKNVLPLLIDSFLTRPDALVVENDEDEEEEWWNKDKQKDAPSSLFSGVAWTAAVKSQILQTIAMLSLNTTSPLSLAYLLSNNYMNELIMGMLPLSQWKEEALEEMLPPFVTLLRGLVMKLRGEEGRGLIPLLICQRSKMGDGTEKEGKESETYLPLLYAAVEVFCYTPGSLVRDADGCMVRTTAMNAILNLCRVTSPDVRAVFVGEGLVHESLPCTTKSAPPPNTLSSMLPSPSSSPISLPASSFPNATIEQRILFPFICSNINKCYHRSVRLMMTSISLDKSSKHDEEAKAEATQRHVDLASTQFSELQYWLGFLDDLLSCEIRVWNVRLVEWVMREVVVGTILLHWIRALKVVEMTAEDEGSEDARKKSLEYCKAKAEVRVSIVFLTQLFAMVSYRPLIRLAGAALLHPKYPIAWCGDDDNDDLFGSSDNEDFFQVTPIINAIVSNKESEMDGGDAAVIPSGGEEADAGAGVKDGAFVSSLHRASLLEMLSGDETIIASMLFGTILENDALDDNALEKLGVLPSPNDDVQVSPFEEALANFLVRNTVDHPDVESRQLTTSPRKYKRPSSSTEAGGRRKSETLSVAVEFVSSLGLMLMERIIFHTWTEGGECLDVVPFDHYYKSSQFIQALTSSLTYFASYTKILAEGDSLEDYFKAEFNRRYVPVDANKDSIHTVYNENNVKMACYLQNYHPSNFIDDANVLLQSSGPPSSESSDDKATKCAIRLILHLRSLVGCIEEFYSRITTISGNRSNALTTKKRWYGEVEALSFCTIEEADELLLSIGGVQKTRVPDVGTEIDLRGRKSFPCSSQNMHKRRRAERELILVVDPTEIYVARCKKGDINRCIILAVVPLSSIIASASAGEILHIVCPLAEVPTGTEEGILKDGRMSLRLSSVNMCLSVKEYLDKYCAALENRAAMDIDELLEKCLEDGVNNSTGPSSSKRREFTGEESWADFQQA